MSLSSDSLGAVRAVLPVGESSGGATIVRMLELPNAIGSILTLVVPIPYLAWVSNTTASQAKRLSIYLVDAEGVDRHHLPGVLGSQESLTRPFSMLPNQVALVCVALASDSGVYSDGDPKPLSRHPV